MASSKPVWRPALAALAICALVWLAGVGVVWLMAQVAVRSLK